MSTSIRHKKSSVAGRTPDAGDLQYGELAINYNDGRLHYKTSTNDVKAFVDSAGIETIITRNFGQVDAHILPTADVTYDLGSETNRFRDLYLSGQSIKLGTITITDSGGNVAFRDSLDASPINVSLEGNTTTDLAEGTNLYYTDARVDNRLTGGTGVTYTSGTIAIGQDVGTNDNVTFANATVAKLTADSANLNNITLTRRNTDPKPSFVGGELFFDSDASKNLTFIPRTKEGNTDVAINIGQEEVVYVFNNTGGQIDNGNTVRFVGADSGGAPTVEKTLASSPISGPIGMATMDIPAGAHGFVTTQGIVRGIDTIRKTTGGPFSVGDRAYICNVQPGGWVKHDIGPDSGYPYELGTVLIADSFEGSILVNSVREHWTRARFSGLVKTSGEVKADGKVTAKAITFDGTVPEYAEGTIFYDSGNGAIAFKNDVADITMQIGQEDWVRVYNNSGSTINNGQPVYISGTQDNFPTIALASATADATVHSIGLATHNISNGTYGYVTTKGVVNDVDTSFGSAGDKIHVGITAGTLQLAAPTFPNFAVDMGYILTADSAGGGGSVLVNIVDHTFEVTRTTGDARVDGDMTVGGDLTVLGTQTIAASENISIGGAFNYFNAGDTIGEANTAFQGSGLDDATFKGHYTGTATAQQFYVKIDGTGGTDTFEWGYDSASPQATGISITGAEQTLNYGISIEFVATTGHTSGDKWTGAASPVNVDTGWFSNRNTGTSGVGYTHMGMFFDVSTEKFTLVEEYDPEPEGLINLDSATLGTLIASTFEGNLTGDVTGNASSASLLQTARTIAISGDVTGTATSFNGGSDITITSSITAGSIVNADINASAAIADTKLATISTPLKVQNSATTATNANTASAIVARDASGNFSANNITGAEFTGTEFIYDNGRTLSNTLTTTSTSVSNLITFGASNFGAMKVFVQGYNSTEDERMVTELSIVHDGTTASSAQYGTVFTGSSVLGQFEVDINSGNVRLRVTPTYSSSTVWKVMQIRMDA